MKGCVRTFFPMTVVLAAAMVLPSAAQQPIIFSKPADASGTAKPDANLAPEPKHETHSLLRPPMSVFETTHPTPSLSPGANYQAARVSPEQLKAWQKILDAKNHWTLMTPEEILGIPTPEKILGLPAKDGEDKLTLDERFLRRGKKTAANLLEIPAAETARRTDSLTPNNGNPFTRKSFESVFARPVEKNSPAQPVAGTAERSGSFLGALLNSSFSSADRPDQRWGNAFGPPTAPVKTTPKQLAGMESFRATMQPAAVFQKAAEPSRAATVTARDPFMNVTPGFNPHGSSFAPLKNDVTRPMGLSPLPGIATRLPETPVRPAAAPNLPPWLREDADKPAGPPTRKF